MLNKFSTEQLIRFFSNTSLPKEKREILLWLNEHEEDQKVLNQIKEIWIVTGKIEEDFYPNVSDAWNNVSKKIDSLERKEKKSKEGLKFQYYFVRIAAAFIIGFTIYSVLNINNSSLQSFSNQIIAVSEKKSIVLPDGSEVWLNKNSSLKYSKVFEGSERIVELNGEAYFEVTKNPNKPFIVKTHSSEVKVLGTSFNYNSFDNGITNILTVNTGKVLFTSVLDNNKNVVLVKGETAELQTESNSIKKSKNRDRNYLSWKTGKLIFENDKFGSIVKALSRQYNIQITIKSKNLKSKNLTVTFDNRSLEDVLNIIDLTLGVTHYKNSDGTIIY